MLQQDNTFPIFLDSAAVILAIILLFGLRFERDLRASPRWIRATNLAFAINLLVWSALGFTLIFYSAHLTAYARAAISHCEWMSGGITLGIVISLGFSRFLKPKV